MKKIIFLILLVLTFAGCSSTITDTGNKILLRTPKANYKKLTLYYDKSVSNVRVNGDVALNGVTYYVPIGKYTVSYRNSPKVNLGLNVNFGDSISDTSSSRDQYRRERERLYIFQDTIKYLEGGNFGVSLSTEYSKSI